MVKLGTGSHDTGRINLFDGAGDEAKGRRPFAVGRHRRRRKVVHNPQPNPFVGHDPPVVFQNPLQAVR